MLLSWWKWSEFHGYVLLERRRFHSSVISLLGASKKSTYVTCCPSLRLQPHHPHHSQFPHSSIQTSLPSNS